MEFNQVNKNCGDVNNLVDGHTRQIYEALEIWRNREGWCVTKTFKGYIVGFYLSDVDTFKYQKFLKDNKTNPEDWYFDDPFKARVQTNKWFSAFMGKRDEVV